MLQNNMLSFSVMLNNLGYTNRKSATVVNKVENMK